MAHFNFEHDGGMTAEKYKKLETVVRQRSSAYMNKAEVEDIVQTIVKDATIAAAKPHATADVATIAFAYARDKTSYYQRARAQAVDHRMAMALNAEVGNEFENPNSTDFTRSIDVRAVLRSLPKDLARVLWLCDAVGHTLMQASDMLGVPVATLHRRRAQAREAFKAAWVA